MKPSDQQGKTMTNQEIFNKVWHHLKAQDRCAVGGDNGNCQLRFYGAACAVGCLMTDEEYDPAMEAFSGMEEVVDGSVNIFSAWVHENFSADQLGLLLDLQGAHDRGDDWLTFEVSLIGIADEWQLLIPVGEPA